MNEKNHENQYLSIKDLLSESILRDLILFTFLFLLLISQVWDNIFFLLFPIITFTFSLFFRILSVNKKKAFFEKSEIVYNPLGSEVRNANRFFFSAQFQLILIFWLGAESLYNPHLVNNYYSFFISILTFSFTFTFFWIFIDLWKFARFEILINGIESRFDSQISIDSKNVISFLKLKSYKIISVINLLVFIILNILNLISIFLINSNPTLGMQLSLPGAQLINFSYLLYMILFISPIITILVHIFNYKVINNFNEEKLEKVIEPLPRNIQIKIIENLKSLNNKIKEQLKTE
ncbi:MAG: hypothetical protein ACFFDY_14280 [Candidatus Thorarchaeota archaeon]